ncbi:hypothetical protein Taro_053248 [Colocasia esculenta]|uniref:Transcription factor GAMYB n=1 Tax=Colocasia esculenta TaxID=4460 RepID=A0A843XM27_COLES|nr:hypothetical protein [Colocasia esculenta]
MTHGRTRDGPLPTPAASASAAPDQKMSGLKRPADSGKGDAVRAMRAVGAITASGMKKGPWTAAEDAILLAYVTEHGEGNWNAVQRNTGLSRCGKSCRLRWANHLRPNLKKGAFSPEEEHLVLQLHAQMGNKWARMASLLPGRTDNEIKNYWNTRLKRRLRAGLHLYPPDIQQQAALPCPATPPSLFDLNAQFSAPLGNSPLDLFDRISFSGTAAAAGTSWAVPNPHILGHCQPQFVMPPPLSMSASQPQRVKRLREYDDVSFSLPFNTNPVPRLPSKASFFQYNSLPQYDPGPSSPPPFSLPQQLSFSKERELPSSQLFQESSTVAAGSSGVGRLPPEQSNDLLDDLLRHPHQPVCTSSSNSGGGHHHHQGESLMPELVSPDLKWVEATMGDSFAAAAAVEPMLGARLESASGCGDTNLSIKGMVWRPGPAQKMKMDQGDFSALPQDVAPMAMTSMAAAPTAAAPREWLASGDGWEGSHGQSSSAVADDVDLDMLQLASSLSMAPQEDHNCCAGPCQFWDGKPAGFR